MLSRSIRQPKRMRIPGDEWQRVFLVSCILVWLNGSALRTLENCQVVGTYTYIYIFTYNLRSLSGAYGFHNQVAYHLLNQNILKSKTSQDTTYLFGKRTMRNSINLQSPFPISQEIFSGSTRPCNVNPRRFNPPSSNACDRQIHEISTQDLKKQCLRWRTQHVQFELWSAKALRKKHRSRWNLKRNFGKLLSIHFIEHLYVRKCWNLLHKDDSWCSRSRITSYFVHVTSYSLYS